MKKSICMSLTFMMMFSICFLFGCGKKTETLKMGLGVQVVMTKATDATEDKEGQGTVEMTAAAVTIDKDGKIVSCVIDTADNTVTYTADGKAITNTSFKTKYELYDSYHMKEYSGIGKEWYEQVDAFTALIQGKTLPEVKALVADGGKGNDEVIASGCTVSIADWVLAVEKAYHQAKDSGATATHALKLGVHTEQTISDANEDKNGKNQVETTFFAVAVDADGKIIAVATDCAQVAFTFDLSGVSTTDITKSISTKRELGDSYHMKEYGGAGKEWYEQADAFASRCIGKRAGDVASLMGDDGYGTADVRGAGCTISVNGFVKAAAKIK